MRKARGLLTVFCHAALIGLILSLPAQAQPAPATPPTNEQLASRLEAVDATLAPMPAQRAEAASEARGAASPSVSTRRRLSDGGQPATPGSDWIVVPPADQ